MGFAIGYQNLEKSVGPQINSIVPKHSIQIYFYTGQANVGGYTTTSYSDPISTKCSIQQESNQNLMHIDGIDLSRIYYRFYVQSEIISGLNRVTQTAQDYIVWDGLKYTIVSVFDSFKTGWKYVIAVLENE